MEAEYIAEHWYAGNFVIEEELLNNDAMRRPNAKAREVYGVLFNSNKVRAEDFYKHILKHYP